MIRGAVISGNELFVQDGLFGFLIEEVQVVGVQSDLDLLAGLAGSAGINAGDDIAFLAGGAQVQVGFGTHQFCHFNVHVDGGAGIFGELGVVVMDVFRTDAHDNFLADVAFVDELGDLLLGNNDLVIAEGGNNILSFTIQFHVEEVHLGASDEAGHELVGGIVVQVLGGIHLLHNAVLHNNDTAGHGHSFGLVMGNVDEGCLQSLMQLRDLSTHGNAQLGVQVGQGFVEQADLRLTDDSTSQSNTLALTAGQSLRLAVQIGRASCRERV